MAVTAVDSVLSIFGIQPSAVTSALYRAVLRFGDRGKRLDAIEVGGLVQMEFYDALAEPLQASPDDTIEAVRTKNAIQAGMLKAFRNTSLALVTAADRDGSTANKQ